MNANALAQVREALKILSKALPELQPGSEPYKGVYDAIGKINKVVPASDEVPGVQQTALRNLGQDAQKSSMMQALMRAQGGQQPPEAAMAGAA
jgi:hypothetical protein